MRTRDLSFDLPRELIAQEPSSERGRSRLMVTDRKDGSFQHRTMTDLVDHVDPGTIMVFNDSRVRRARVYARAEDSGARQEFLLVAPRNGERTRWLVIGPNAKKLRPGRTFRFGPEETLAQPSGEVQSPGGTQRPGWASPRDSVVAAEVTGVEEPYRELTFSRPVTEEWLDEHGHMPLPPYIRREDAPMDVRRYQTVYARVTGSVAAPTAGLHFTESIFQALRDKGVTICFVTLHVGIGTFLPVRTEVLEDHVMHREEFSINPETARILNDARAGGNPVLAVGTTAVRALESAGQEGVIEPGHRDTEIFILPGYRFRVVDQLFTNFHTPESTLLALVSAFAGRERVLRWYNQAVQKRYRFFSYGDAMLIR